ATGTTNSVCGPSGGVCLDCTNAGNGHVCVAGACGCNSSADCPAGKACDTNLQVCTTTCLPTQPCNGGCCSHFKCLTGAGASSARGAAGNAGAACWTSMAGAVCLAVAGGGGCGCNVATDCPVGQACNSTTHLCSSGCGAGASACNGGCCDPGSNQCVAG